VTGGLHGLFLHEACLARFKSVRSCEFKTPERNGAFGLDARVGKEGADQRTEQKAEWSGGVLNSAREHFWGEPSLAVFGGVVF
jgi:hypothetical protein